MAKDFSFDIECQFDFQEVKNAIDQVNREISTRFDFKGVTADINLSEDKIIILTDSQQKLESIKDIIISKLVKRNQSSKILDFSKKAEEASQMKLRQEVSLVKALSPEDIKILNKEIKDNFKKVKTNIQGSTLRVMSASKNDLQEVIKMIRSSKKVDLPLTITNFR